MDIQLIIVWYVTLLVSLVVHEAAHALVALIGGDQTAYLGGQVSLNPVPHIRREPFGTVILPLGLLLMSEGTMTMGYATTPIDARWAYDNPKKAALMSAAGPLSNVLLAAIAFGILKGLILLDYASGSSQLPLLVRPTGDEGWVYATALMASLFFLLNIFLALLNLLPVPPLDGSGIIEGLFPKSRPLMSFIASQPYIPLLLFVMVLMFFGEHVWQPVCTYFWRML